jgi:hypothetical protein
VAAAIAVSGCAVLGSDGSQRSTSTRLEQAQRTHEYPAPPPPPETVASAQSGAIQAIRAFATGYINWSADTVAADMSSLASRSVGQARAAMELAAAQTAQDYELQRGGISNSGTVEAIAPLAGHHGQYLVVTRELTTAANTTVYEGLRPAWHVALATVARVPSGGWAVSRWQPET